MSHFALQLMRHFRNVQPDLTHSPADAHPGHLVLLSVHRKPVNPRENYQLTSSFWVRISTKPALSFSVSPFSLFHASRYMTQYVFTSH